MRENTTVCSNLGQVESQLLHIVLCTLAEWSILQRSLYTHFMKRDNYTLRDGMRSDETSFIEEQQKKMLIHGITDNRTKLQVAQSITAEYLPHFTQYRGGGGLKRNTF